MELDEFLDHLNSGNTVHTGSEVHQFMHKAAQEALKPVSYTHLPKIIVALRIKMCLHTN